MAHFEELTEHVGLYRSAVTVGVVRDGDSVLLVDCDDAGVVDELAERGLSVERAVFTHYHRDSAGGARGLADRGVDLVVPAGEREYFADATAFWADPGFRFRRYESLSPGHLLLPESVPVADTVAPGETVRWGAATVTAHATPGHTESGLSYRVDADGQRSVFTGDAVCGDGRLWDAYSLQRSRTDLTDYHSFLGERNRLVDGLRAVVETDPDRLVPLRGGPIRAPAAAVDRLAGRLGAAYDNYASVAALRHYFPGEFADAPPTAMPVRDGVEPPAWVDHADTSWLLRSADGPALLVDCGSPAVLDRLETWEREGTIDGVEAVWLSHYHFDHVDAVDALLARYDIPVLAAAEVADVVEAPAAHRLPVLSEQPVPVDRRLADGERWTFREWTLTAHWLPGQTYYHGGLVAEGHGLRLLFAGDAVTMAGLDDYCPFNRNLLGEGRGFDRCLQLIGDTDPTHILNCHVDRAFDFTDAELETMRDRLAERVDLFDALLAWEHPNFGLDPGWVRCDPYHQTLAPGERGRVGVAVTNHAPASRTVTVRPRLPAAWRLQAGGTGTDRASSVDVPPGEAVTLTVPFRVPAGRRPGTVVVPVDIGLGDRDLPRFGEAVVAVAEP